MNADELIEAIKKLQSELKRDEKWALLTPHGEIYTGTPEQLIPMLARNTEFMRMNFPHPYDTVRQKETGE